jgi:protein-S-isoprenylcysteine O-methyltransferase Ste14
MEFIPELKIGWLNGWIILASLALTDGILFLVFKKETVKQLFDRSGWKKWQIAVTVLGKLIALVVVLMIIFTPLKLNHPVLLIGISISGLGLGGLIKALLDFQRTRKGKPATSGIYQITRHPQILGSSVVILGASVAIGSWLALILLLLARIFLHANLVAEEEVCLRVFGVEYQKYLDRVPRYLLF